MGQLPARGGVCGNLQREQEGWVAAWKSGLYVYIQGKGSTGGHDFFGTTWVDRPAGSQPDCSGFNIDLVTVHLSFI